MNELKEIRQRFGWQLDQVNKDVRDAALKIADDVERIREAVKGGMNVDGFDNTRAANGARLDVAIAKRKQLAEFIGALDYAIKALEAEEASQ